MGGELVAWTLVSGMYQMSDDLAFQYGLPREIYWRLVAGEGGEWTFMIWRELGCFGVDICYYHRRSTCIKAAMPHPQRWRECKASKKRGSQPYMRSSSRM